MLYAYVFDINYGPDGPGIGYHVEVTGLVSEQYKQEVETAKTAYAAAKRIGVIGRPIWTVLAEIIRRDGLDGKLNALVPLFLRAKVTGGDLYLVTSFHQQSWNDLEILLRYLQKDGNLKSFLDSARI